MIVKNNCNLETGSNNAEGGLGIHESQPVESRLIKYRHSPKISAVNLSWKAALARVKINSKPSQYIFALTFMLMQLFK